MTFPVLARAIRSSLTQPGVRRVEFVWHGGEASLLGLDFYRKVMWLQEQFRRADQVVANSIQTNGTRLSDEWVEFLRAYDIGVGISLDGPPEVHDRQRVDTRGRTTSAAVRDGLARVRAAGIRNTGVLCVVDQQIVDLGAQRLLEYLLQIDARGVALLNVLPENRPPGDALHGAYLPLPRFVEFLRELFSVWWPDCAERLRIRELATLVDALRGGPPGLCIFAGDCFGGYITVEPTGELSACDKYIGDSAYTFGNVLTTRFGDIQTSARLQAVKIENQVTVDAMGACPWFSICRGGCPHDRYVGSRYLPAYDAACCGFRPLLETIAECVSIK
jgi:uncharacterized protein